MGTDPFEVFIGKTVSGYRIDRILGRGGMGVVFLAQQLRLDRPVALKVLPPLHTLDDPTAVDRFEAEARIIARLQHPSIVQVYDMVEAEGHYWIAMEYLKGGSAGAVMRRSGPLAERLAARVAMDGALGLWAASEAGVVHRDMKPQNLLLTDRDEAKVADFGVAHVSDRPANLTRTGFTLGTPAYMPPEQWNDSRLADHRSDLYALGATLYCLLIGEPPYPGPSMTNLFTQHAQHPVPDPRAKRPELSVGMASLVQRLLAKKPEDRVQTGLELAHLLEPIARSGGQAGSARPARHEDPPTSPIPRGSGRVSALSGTTEGGRWSPPVLDVTPSPSSLSVPPPAASSPPPPAAPPPQRWKALIVDDNDSVANSLAYALRREGFEVFLAGDGEAGLEEARARSPDIILLDVRMPVMSGFDVLQTLRIEGCQVPIIMVTGEMQEADKVRSFDLGADDYVTKPYGLAELVARVHARLRRR